MRCTWMVGPVLVVALGACAAQPSNDDATSSASTPAGFETWLERVCPAGRQVALHEDANAGEPRTVATCEDLRRKAMAEEGTRQRLIDVYLSQVVSTVDGGPEDVGEAKQQLLLSLLCGMVVMMGGIGASRTCPSGDSGCSEGVTGGGFAMSLLCSLLPF